MKSVVAPFDRMAWCVRIVCTDGATVVRLTAHPRDLKMSNGQVYVAQSGYDFTGQTEGTSMAPGVMDMHGIANEAGIGRDAVASGVFDNARVYLFACDYTNPVEDYEPIGLAIFGKSRFEDERYVAELMMLIDAMNQSVGETYTPGCKKTFGGQDQFGCGVDLSLITVTGAITAVTSSSVVRDASRGEAADWFGAGTIRFTSGANAGLKPLEIKSYDADGTVTTFEPFYYAPQVGDAYEMVPGCRKRRTEDCRNKWNNVPRFGGFADMPTSSVYSQVGSRTS